MTATPACPPVLIEVTCPNCQKKHSVAITSMAGANVAGRAEIKCAYCQQPWEQLLPGPVMAGPFPK
jgi:transcription elongation factor Elf1